MKIVHIITKLELGGAQQNTLHTLGHLDRDRFSGLLLTHPDGILVEDALADGRYEVRFVPSLVREVRPFSDLRTLLALRSLLRRELESARKKYGEPRLLVHTHSSKAGILGRTAARLAGVPLVIHSIHGYGFHDYQPRMLRRFYIFLERVVSRWTTHFIAVSRANRETGLALGLFGPGRVSVIRSGIDIDAYRGAGLDRRAKRKELGVREGAPLAGMVACFKEQKNPEDFVRCAALVSERIPEAEFLLVGDGPLRPAVERAVRENRLEGRFHLTGWRRDVAEIIPLFDVLVLTSLWEGLPRVFPQAMAAARPIVAYAVDGGPEAVADGVNGHLVAPGDYRRAAELVAGLLADPDRADRLGKAGAGRVGEFDAGLMVRQQEDLYERLWQARY